eukprot:1431328-Prymnesium_polylepis.1
MPAAENYWRLRVACICIPVLRTPCATPQESVDVASVMEQADAITQIGVTVSFPIQTTVLATSAINVIAVRPHNQPTSAPSASVRAVTVNANVCQKGTPAPSSQRWALQPRKKKARRSCPMSSTLA